MEVGAGSPQVRDAQAHGKDNLPGRFEFGRHRLRRRARSAYLAGDGRADDHDANAARRRGGVMGWMDADWQFETYEHVRTKRADGRRHLVIDEFVSHRTRNGRGCVGRLVDRERKRRRRR